MEKPAMRAVVTLALLLILSCVAFAGGGDAVATITYHIGTASVTDTVAMPVVAITNGVCSSFIYTGWHMIGAPETVRLDALCVRDAQGEALPWAEAVARGWVGAQVWRWDEISLSQAAASLEPGDEQELRVGTGYWLLTNRPGLTVDWP